jgi:hypothetical protein
LRAALAPAEPAHVARGLLAIALLGLGTGLLGKVVLARMLGNLRRSGSMGLS